MRSDDPQAPWRDYEALRALAGDLGARLIGSQVDGLAGGPGWLRLSFPAGDRHDLLHLYLVARRGAALVWDSPAVLPDTFDDVLGRVRQKDLTVTPYLRGARLQAVHVPPDDRLLKLVFDPPPGRAATVLAMQVFGQRGNIALVDRRGRRLWSAHRSPHPVLLDPPRPDDRVPPGPDAGIAAAARDLAPKRLAAVLTLETADRLDALLSRALKSTRRLAENLRRDLENAGRGDHYRRQGETLAIHLHTLRKGAETIELADAEGEPLEIRLDPALGPAENMELCFKKARKADRGYALIERRSEETETRLRTLERLASELAALPRSSETALDGLLRWRRDKDAELRPFTKQDIVGRRLPKEAPLPFRRYMIDGKWPVWIGRDNRENDELTHKAAASDDIWMHAQGVPGSHLILRTAGQPQQVPGHVLEKAASLAALHSKARNAALVPVIHTLRKYVRKPRKSAAGAAACEREKSLMVAPGVPEGVESL